ncbi:N-acetyltransferase [Magnetovibrio sp.]|uniref:GNAT family N-acetyltransferase n=1 Tax=Magnetovibrio sp. TaxID=2024836 RepID=UPI002F938459
MYVIREAMPQDWPGIWTIFHDVVARGDTYAFAPDTDEAEAKCLWLDIPRATYVALEGEVVVGTYYLKTNQLGAGSHVCNAGYMVREDQRGRGLGRALCAHSLDVARTFGYHAMQFNFVARTNVGAVKLWRDMGFEIAGVLPEAFNHPQKGYVDAFVMYRLLAAG